MGSGEVKDVPRDLILLQGPLGSTYGEGALAYTESQRAVVVITDVDPQGRLRRRVDLVRESNWSTIAADPQTAWWHTLSATAELAVLESAFPTSTVGMLEGKTLQVLKRGKHNLETGDDLLDREHARLLYRHSGDIKLGVPGVAGFFVVEPKTGTVFGLLPDGTRGSRNTSEQENLIAILSNVLAIMATVGKVGLVGGTALGVVAIYGKHLVRMYGAVATAIATMDASDLDEEVEAALQSLACEITIAIFFAPGSKGLGAALNRLLKAVGLNPCAAI